MSPDVIIHEAGTAKRLLTMPADHYTVEVGDWMPYIVEGAPQVLELLNLRARAKAEAARR
ncbi:hypothetical protein ACGFIW_02085 [Micromonospora sp. NPDC048935]|uniref:hypothetical protein n=1 Tax=Micromonospora sp. NPDC048935 TaxID=3364262 RepID=UPI003713097A